MVKGNPIPAKAGIREIPIVAGFRVELGMAVTAQQNSA